MRERAERLRTEAWRWHRLATENLLAAEYQAANSRLPGRIACFWAEQAGELAKAVLVAEDVDPPKTQDLVGLAARCRAAAIEALDRTPLDELSEWSVAARYPAEVPDADPDMVERLLSTARRVVSAASLALEEIVGPEPRADASGPPETP